MEPFGNPGPIPYGSLLEPKQISMLQALPPSDPVPPPSDVIATWDNRLRALWSARLSEALDAAGQLFAPMETEEATLPDAEQCLAAEFWRVVNRRQPKCPESAVTRYQDILTALWLMLRAVRQAPTIPFVEDYLVVALRPVRRLKAGALTPALCTILYDYHRGLWTPHLTRPQLYTIRVALAKTLASLPPDSISAFWQCLQSEEPMMREAMRIGLQFLCSAHAVPHLLRGLERSRDPATQAALVNLLEQIGDPRAIATLIRLKRETAISNWALSRQIARALRVIERQNQGQHHRTLLRPSLTPSELSEADRSLLRPATDTQEEREDRARSEPSILLRPANDPNEPSA